MTRPWLAVILFKKVGDILHVKEVDEAVRHVAVRFEVETEVQKVVTTEAGLIQHMLDLDSLSTSWNVVQHDGSANLASFLDSTENDRLPFFIVARKLVGTWYTSGRRELVAERGCTNIDGATDSSLTKG